MRIEDQADYRLIRLAGRLSVAEVHGLLQASHGRQSVLRLDLGELMSVDPVGLEVLLDLQQHGAARSGRASAG